MFLYTPNPITLILCPTYFMPLFFNAPHQCTPFLNLRPLIFGLKPFGSLSCIILPLLILLRIIAGNRDFYANQKMFQNKLLSKKSKLKLYWTLIRPVVTYACEKWVLKENSIQKLMIFERKILRKVFEPTKEENGLWRIKTNEELDELIKRKNIIRFIKSQRLKWLGYVERLG